MPRETDDLDLMLSWAQAHGEDDLRAYVGDLQDLLRLCWPHVPYEKRGRVLKAFRAQMADVIDLPSEE